MGGRSASISSLQFQQPPVAILQGHVEFAVHYVEGPDIPVRLRPVDFGHRGDVVSKGEGQFRGLHRVAVHHHQELAAVRTIEEPEQGRCAQAAN